MCIAAVCGNVLLLYGMFKQFIRANGAKHISHNNANNRLGNRKYDINNRGNNKK